MAAYFQVDDEGLIRSLDGLVLCHTTGSRPRPVSITGMITDTGGTVAVEGNVRLCLIGSPRLRISPSMLADLVPSQLKLMKGRCLMNAYDRPFTGSRQQLQELSPAEVVNKSVLPVVESPCSPPERLLVDRVSSRGAREGQSRVHRH